MQRPEVSLIIVTYQAPGHLRRVLASVARQTVLDRIEIIVTDDGSTDSTRQVVAEFSQTLGRPIAFVTHPHQGFHLTRCRNNGARVATAPYLLFLDGDCLIPPDHVERYLHARRPNVVHFGYCCRLEREVSEQIDVATIATADFAAWATWSERIKLAKIHGKSLFYNLLRHPSKPALKGGNIGIWQRDYQRLNGFDENFQAWGCEDDDLTLRVQAAGLRIASILGATRTYHLWHPPAVSKPAQKWSEGANVAYLKRRGRLTQCLQGLQPRTLHDLRVGVAGNPEPRQARHFLRQVFGRDAAADDNVEMEIMFSSGPGQFSSAVDCRVLVASSPEDAPLRVRKQADLILPAHPSSAAEFLQRELHIASSTTSHRRAA